jgi:hypothetical protein
VDKPPDPEPEPPKVLGLPHPSPLGTAALSSLVVCGVLGLPLLLAFGLGLIVWAIGLLSALAYGLAGLYFDRAKARAVIALALVFAVCYGGWWNGHHH